MIQILDKKYDAGKMEEKWHKKWADAGIYNFSLNRKGSDQKVYSIDTPPPFTSGTLHMGHVYNHVWIDIIARYKRMRGYSVYLPQGFDCHGLPTELRVEKELGVKKENREEFLKKCRQWTDTAIARMRDQFDAIGYSADWNYTYRTMDDTYKALVQKTLMLFYEKNLLYREKHPVLWCPRCETALAKAETGHIEREGRLYHIDLDVGDGGGKTHKLTIATTRPEMMPSCVAVFVHPDDGRYKKFTGKKAKLPIFDREVPIMADDVVDMEFGTGVVYLCTFGDEQDIAWQKKYDLPVIESLDKRGNMTDAAGRYAGLTIKEARKKITEDLTGDGHIRKVEKFTHNVLSHTERGSCNTPIELMPTEQWFIRVKEFTEDIIRAAEEMNWYPKYMLQRLIDWSKSMDWDWIISRQRVFGTPIPFWVCSCGEIIPADEPFPMDPRGTTKKCPKCGKDAAGDKDVCDCWVDSSVTPLVISRWGAEPEFFKKTYPSSLRPQGYEIIRTWAFYTIHRNLILTGKACFNDLVINGMVAGPDKRKMSKSLGNVIEPEEPLRKYSADTIRQWAASGTLGDDYPFSWEECEHSQKFLTKLWNISRFMEMHFEDFDGREPKELNEIDRWILSRLQNIVREFTENLDGYVFNIPLDQIRTFIWHDLADNYMEMAKHRLYKPEIYGEDSKRSAQYTMKKVLETSLKLLAPFTPHICEEIWENMFGDGGQTYVTIAQWPEFEGGLVDKEAEETGKIAGEIVAGIRKYKSGKGISLGTELEHLKISAGPKHIDRIKRIEEDIRGTGKIKNLEVVGGDELKLEFS